MSFELKKISIGTLVQHICAQRAFCSASCDLSCTPLSELGSVWIAVMPYQLLKEFVDIFVVESLENCSLCPSVPSRLECI